MTRTGRPPVDPLARFWGHVEPEPNTGCWLWTSATSESGYAVFTDAGRKTCRAHRWSYEHFVGPIPEGLVIDHLCRTSACVNPAHLEPVTQRENVRRGLNGQKTTCLAGHPYDREDRRGWRYCRACKTERARQRLEAIA